MTIQKKEWYYGDEEKGQWVGPFTNDELDALRGDGTIEEFTNIVNKHMLRHQEPGAQGVPYSMISRLNVEFAPTVEALYAARAGKPITVLSGPNNGGKTLLLKQLFLVWSNNSSRLAVPKEPEELTLTN